MKTTLSSLIEGSKGAYEADSLIQADQNHEVADTMVAYMGDSEVVGTGATVGSNDAAAQAGGILSKAGFPVTDGVIMCYDHNKGDGIKNTDSRMTTTGTWTVGGLVQRPPLDYQYHIAAKASGASIKFSFSKPCTRFELYVFGNSGPYTYSVDGGSAVEGKPNGNSELEVISIPAGAMGKHTLTVTVSSKKTVYVMGARAFHWASVEVSKIGFWGARAVAGLPRTWWNIPEWFKAVKPEALILQYGTNEALHGGYTTAQYKGMMSKVVRTARQASPGIDIYMMSSIQPNVSDSTWDTWRNAQYDVADENGIRLADMTAKVGHKSEASGLYSDATHPNVTGYGHQAELVANLIRSK